MLRYFLLLFTLSFNFCNNLNALFDLSKLVGGEKTVDFGFVVIDNLTSLKEKLESEIKNEREFENNFAQDESIIKDKSNNIEVELLKIDGKFKMANEEEREYFIKYISFLNEKKQVLITQFDLQKETLKIIKDNLKKIRVIIETKEKPIVEVLSSSYSWKEFQEISKKFSAKITRKDSEFKKKQTLEEQKETENKFLESNEQQKSKKVEELKALEEEIERGTKDKDKISQRALLKEEISLLEEKNKLYKVRIRNLEEQIKAKDNEIELLEIEIDIKNKELKEIEKNILPTSEDVSLARQEWSIESQKTQIAKDDWEKKKTPIRLEIDSLNKELDSLIKQEKIAKEGKDQIKIFLIESQVQKVKTVIEEKNKRLKVIESEKERLDLKVAAQKLQYEIINAHYQSSIDKSMIKNWLQSLKNQKGLAVIHIKDLDRKLDEEVSAQPESLRKLEQIKVKKEDFNLKKTTIFKLNNKAFVDVITNINDTHLYLNNLQGLSLKNLTIISDQIKSLKQMIGSYDFTIKQLEKKYVSENIWKRSTKAISLLDLTRSLEDAEGFFIKFFWNTPGYFGPSNIIKSIKNLKWPNYLGLILFILLFAIFLAGIKVLILFLMKRVNAKIQASQASKHAMQVYTTIDALLIFSLNNFKLLFSWFFVYFHVLFDFKYIFSTIEFMVSSYFISIFYLATIPIWLYLSSSLLAIAQDLNKRLSYLFFAEKTQTKFIFLLTAILYSTATLIPLRQAFLNYIDTPSVFPNLMFAAYSLILVAIILFFFGKEDILTIVPPRGKLFIWLREKIEKYYYPVFVFFMGLLILSNPYIGYSNLAWFLAFAVPGSALILYGMFLAHYYVRKYSSSFFLKEDGEEILDRFEQAKVYYGFFIILSFLALAFFSFVLITRIWQLDYTIVDLWKNLSQDWVIRLGEGAYLGIVQFLILISFIIAGFLISSLTKKFVFNKLFDIFRTEPGAQNTMFRIAHYIIITLALILGFAAIQLKDFIFYIGGFSAVGIGFALKDLLADYVSGLFILIERQIEIGNFIQIDEVTMGTVQKISARATTIRTARNFSVVVPNKDIVSKPLINWGHGRMSVAFELSISVDYGQNFEKIKEVLQKTIESHESILKVPGVVVRLEKFGDNGVEFFVRAFVSSRKLMSMWQISSEVRFSIIRAFRENHFTLAYPQVVVHKPIMGKEERGLKTMSGIDIKYEEDMFKQNR
ncbi:MAG: mechanosensitive ion channel domain-containing protein [bacterium]